MAKLTESYLRNMIKQVLNENFEVMGDPASPEEEPYFDTNYDMQDLFGLIGSVRSAIKSGNVAKAETRLSELEAIARKIDDRNYAGFDREAARTDAKARLRSYVGGSGASDPHLSPTMDESRKRK